MFKINDLVTFRDIVCLLNDKRKAVLKVGNEYVMCTDFTVPNSESQFIIISTEQVGSAEFCTLFDLNRRKVVTSKNNGDIVLVNCGLLQYVKLETMPQYVQTADTTTAYCIYDCTQRDVGLYVLDNYEHFALIAGYGATILYTDVLQCRNYRNNSYAILWVKDYLSTSELAKDAIMIADTGYHLPRGTFWQTPYPITTDYDFMKALDNGEISDPDEVVILPLE